jgi:hypothetical protein
VQTIILSALRRPVAGDWSRLQYISTDPNGPVAGNRHVVYPGDCYMIVRGTVHIFEDPTAIN